MSFLELSFCTCGNKSKKVFLGKRNTRHNLKFEAGETPRRSDDQADDNMLS